MGRPRKDASTLDARGRMIEAFWEILAEKPYIRITVGDIAHAAGVNKNTLYYHYECVEDLALDAIRSTLPFDLATQLLEGKSPVYIVSQLSPEKQRDIVGRISLAAGPQGCGILSEMLRTILVGFWLEKHQLEPQDLTEDEALLCRFSSSGLISVFGGVKEADPESIGRFVSSSFAIATVKEVLLMFERARTRKYGEAIGRECRQ